MLKALLMLTAHLLGPHQPQWVVLSGQLPLQELELQLGDRPVELDPVSQHPEVRLLVEVASRHPAQGVAFWVVPDRSAAAKRKPSQERKPVLRELKKSLPGQRRPESRAS
jgi:hypothetical protein